MNESDVTLVINAAVALEMISNKQADLLKEELFMFPGMNPLNIMMRRGMITADQSQTLTKILSGEIPFPTAKSEEDHLGDIELDFDKYTVQEPVEPSSRIPEPPLNNFQNRFEVPTIKSTSAAQNFSTPPVQKSGESRIPPTQHDITTSQAKLQALKDELTARKKDVKPQEVQQEIKTGPAIKQFVNNISEQSRFSESLKSTLPLAAKYPSAWETMQTPAESPRIIAVGPNASLQDYLNAARLAGCSDLHISVGRKPFVRWQGELFFLDSQELTKEQTEQLLFSILTPEQVGMAKANLQLDFAFEIDGLGRQRANIYKQRLGWDGAFRLVSQQAPSLESFGAAGVLSKLTQYHQGLILVTGSAGCGKTTTVASMLDYINKNRSDHIITVEDPVEYVIYPDQCQVTQRQVGPHTESFSNALRAALRQDPDVIMVGELRDLETTSIAISAAETGHLVLGTLHTSSAIRTVARILDVYPPIQRAQICMMVAESLRGIISQQLIPRKDRCGRIAAMEILLFTSGVAQIIKEGKTHQLLSQMQAGRKLGMKTMDDALLELVENDIISGEEGYIRAENKMMFQPHLNRK